MRDILKQKRTLWLLTWPIGIAMYLLAKSDRDIAEKVFARGIFKVYSEGMSRFSSLFPFSLAEVLLIALIPFILTVVVMGIIRIIKPQKRTEAVTKACNTSPYILRLLEVVRLLRRLLIIGGVIFFWYMLGCGTNYYRYEFAEYSGLELKKSASEDLCLMCVRLGIKANEAREAAVERAGADPGMPYRSYLSDSERATYAKSAMDKLAKKYDVLAGYYPKAKAVHFSRVMSEFNITGMYFPWTVESNINVDAPDYTLGATTCHELSHLRGFMREDEANFIGFLACVGSDEPELVYSGYMLALVYSLNRLYADNLDYYSTVCYYLSQGVITDMRDHSQYWDQFKDTVASEVGEKMNNTYLKANNQTDGTKSYGRMVDLLLALARKENWIAELQSEL